MQRIVSMQLKSNSMFTTRGPSSGQSNHPVVENVPFLLRHYLNMDLGRRLGFWAKAGFLKSTGLLGFGDMLAG